MATKFTNDDLTVVYEGEVLTTLNHRLVTKQNLSRKNLKALKETHIFKHMLFRAARATDDPAVLKDLAAKFQLLEFEQQRLWGFPQDARMHRWFEFPKCECPKIDNQERYGTGMGVVYSTCPVHGNNK